MIINKYSQQVIIMSWQHFLNQKGCDAGHLDGIWGPLAENATERFQERNGLKADGIPGPITIHEAEEQGYKIPRPTPFNPAGKSNTIIDISHHQDTEIDFKAVKRSGINVVFHKATEGLNFKDPFYHIRKQKAIDAGLLWGAYHYGRGLDGSMQADYFLDYIRNQKDTLIALDFEYPRTGSIMNVNQAIEFVERIKQITGKYSGIYGGHYLRDKSNQRQLGTLTNCWLWVANYTLDLQPQIPKGWEDYTFWQYTDGIHGRYTPDIPSIGRCDRDIYNSNEEDLKNFWEENIV